MYSTSFPSLLIALVCGAANDPHHALYISIFILPCLGELSVLSSHLHFYHELDEKLLPTFKAS